MDATAQLCRQCVWQNRDPTVNLLVQGGRRQARGDAYGLGHDHQRRDERKVKFLILAHRFMKTT